VQLGRSRPFVVVVPESPSGTGHPCDLVAAAPQAVADDTALRTAVAAAFRTAPAGPSGWGALGIEGGAPCAAAVGLSRPDLYGAAAAVSGRYDTAALARTGAEAPAGAAPRLLLAAAKADTSGLDAVRKLQAALKAGTGQAARADVSTSDIVQDYTPDRERLRLVRVAVQYLAETLAKTP
jgi:poly(3-hydroxybutyrate) depolymerase